jgi:hypothetical protein
MTCTAIRFDLSLCALLLVPLAGSTAALSQSPQSPPSPAFADPEKRLPRLVLSHPFAHGEVDYFISEKEVVIRWFHRGQDGKPLNSFQTETVSFWPTEVCSFDENRLLVAGKDTDTGQALIELWTFEPPQRLPEPYMHFPSGQMIEPDVHVPVVDRKLLLRWSGHGLVRTMLRRQGTPNGVFVQFHETLHVFDLDVSTGTSSLVFAATAVPEHPQVPVLPELADVTAARWSATHEEWGHVYFLGALPDTRGLYLFDHDKSGTIDEYGLLTLAESRARKLNQGQLYEAFY